MKAIVSMSVVGGLILGAASAATGAIVYDNEADFLAMIQSGYYLEDFDGYTYGSFQGETLDLEANGYAYTLSAYGAGSAGLWSGDGNMSTNSALNPITVDFTGLDVTAIGGFFFASEINGFYMPGSMVLVLSDGTQITYDPPNDTTFRGFTSDVPIVQMTIDAVDTDVYKWATMDHFYVGAMIPAPSGLAMLGAVGLLGLRRRR
ncbi:MAG: hypothetical protein KAS72_03175 [Phycisphaerales bacterium]|nr:hypothetical protein [Phycisphaerales bacterium]